MSGKKKGQKEGSCSATPAEGACATGSKGKCCGKAMAGALLGGIVMFIWFSASWMLLPWHHDIMSFKDEKAVATAVGQNIAGDGVYVIPFTNMGKEEQKTEKPFAFVVTKAEGVNIKETMPLTMGKGFLFYVFLAGLLGCLLSKKGEEGCPVLFSAKVGLVAGLCAALPNYIWFHFPLNYTLVGVADFLIAFTLAGMVMAKLVFKMKIGCCPKVACGKGACEAEVIDKTEDK